MIIIVNSDTCDAYHYPTSMDAYHDLQDYDLNEDDLPTRETFIKQLDTVGFIFIGGTLDIYKAVSGI